MYISNYVCKELAGTELGQAQLKLELYYTLIFCRFGFIELAGGYSCSYFFCNLNVYFRFLHANIMAQVLYSHLLGLSEK